MATKSEGFRTSRKSPEVADPQVRAKLALEAVTHLQQIERAYIGHDSVDIRIPHDNPIWVICAGDLHLGSLATDHKAIIELRDLVLSNPNIGLVLLGDELEGIKQAYLNTNTTRAPLDFHKQIDLLRHSFLIPLAAESKILGMVSGYWGHPGWAEDATTINTWLMMTDGLDIPVIRNGGSIKIKFANNHQQRLQIFHNPTGRSQFEPVFGLRKAAFKQSEAIEEGRHHGHASGHIHRSGVAKENYPHAKIAPYYISSGTTKGSNPDLPPDRFGVKLGLPLTDPLGQGVVIMPRRRGQRFDRNYPTASFDQGSIVHQALDLLNRTEQQNLTDELLEKIRAVEPKPKVELNRRRSSISQAPYDERPKKPLPESSEAADDDVYRPKEYKPQFDSLYYDVTTRLPIALHLISNARLGSSYEGYQPLLKYQSDLIANNPHAFTVFLRNMLDKEVPELVERQEVLDRYVKLIKSTNSPTLAIMLDASMRLSRWKKPITDHIEHIDEDEDEDRVTIVHHPPIPPGTYLSEKTGVPLIHHLSLIKLSVGPNPKVEGAPLYIGAFADKLFQHGSFSRPTYGLKRLYDLYLHQKPGYVAGGHMPNSGSMIFFDRGNPETKYPILVAPGWWAAYIDSAGKGNVTPGAVPGQAIIFMPGQAKKDYLAFPTTNADETEYLHDALLLLKGLDLLGIPLENILGQK